MENVYSANVMGIFHGTGRFYESHVPKHFIASARALPGNQEPYCACAFNIIDRL